MSLRVVHITTSFFPKVGGLENFVRELALYSMRVASVRASVCVCTVDHGEQPQEYSVGEIPVRVVPTRRVGFFQRLPDMSGYVEGADVVHVHDPRLLGIAPHFARRRYGVPLVISTHGAFFHTKRLRLAKHVYFETIVKRVLRRFQLVIATSANDEATFKRITDRVIRIENGIDFEKFRMTTAIGAAQESNLSIVYFGRLALNKGLERLIECLGGIRDRETPARLHIVGENFDGVEETLKQLTRRLSLDNAVRFHGCLTDQALREVIGESRFFASASEYEGFGLSAVEAMAAGKVVLLNTIPPFERLVTDGVNGFLVDFSSVPRASDQLARVLSRPGQELDLIAERALQRAESYSWQNRIPEFMTAYEQARRSAMQESPS